MKHRGGAIVLSLAQSRRTLRFWCHSLPEAAMGAVIGEHLMRFELLDEIDREFQRQIHRLLVHDELTGLLTSKSFFSELRREAARAEFDARPFCVLMMDLDHFKVVNDTYGHLAG